jgi:hypothetical protein
MQSMAGRISQWRRPSRANSMALAVIFQVKVVGRYTSLPGKSRELGIRRQRQAMAGSGGTGGEEAVADSARLSLTLGSLHSCLTAYHRLLNASDCLPLPATASHKVLANLLKHHGNTTGTLSAFPAFGQGKSRAGKHPQGRQAR